MLAFILMSPSIMPAIFYWWSIQGKALQCDQKCEKKCHCAPANVKKYLGALVQVVTLNNVNWPRE